MLLMPRVHCLEIRKPQKVFSISERDDIDPVRTPEGYLANEEMKKVVGLNQWVEKEIY